MIPIEEHRVDDVCTYKDILYTSDPNKRDLFVFHNNL